MGSIRKTILILGASGFIGRNLVEQMHNQYQLLIPTHSQLDLLVGEKVTAYFRSHKIDVVINAVIVGGSRQEEHETQALRNNLLMFFNLISNRKYYQKLIHFGSGAEYDKSKPIIEVKENDFGKTIPQDDYGLFKYICSKYIEYIDKVVCLRIFGLFGKYEDYRYRFISNAICLNLLKKPITMNQNVYFSYVYIDDFVKIVKYFIDYNSKTKFFNIGRNEKIDLLTIAKKINSISDFQSKIIIKKKGLNNEYTCDNSRLIKEIKRLSFTNFDDSLRKLYNWYKNKNINQL